MVLNGIEAVSFIRDRSLFIPWGGGMGGGSCKVHLVLWGGGVLAFLES